MIDLTPMKGKPCEKTPERLLKARGGVRQEKRETKEEARKKHFRRIFSKKGGKSLKCE